MNAILVMLASVVFMKSSWPAVIALVLGVAAFFAVNLIVRQESLLYVPCVMPGMQAPPSNPEGLRSPKDHRLNFEDVHLTTSDGVRLHAWFIPCGADSRTAPTVLFCHANAGNIGLRIPNYAAIVEKLQANVFAFDYRGYGHSEGSPSEEGLIEDVQCAWKWLQDAAASHEIDGTRLFVFGRSLGGAVAVALASTLSDRGDALPAGVILENTFTSIYALVDVVFPILAFKSLKDRFLRLRWDTLSRISKLETPMLFLSGTMDELVPSWHMEALHAGAVASPLRHLEAVPEGTHNDTWEKGGDEYWMAQGTFLKKCARTVAA